MLNLGFVFVPADLEYFIQCEKADQDRRLEISRHTGTIPVRVCPTAESYREHQINSGAVTSDACGGTYLRFTLRDYFPKLGQPALYLAQVLFKTLYHGTELLWQPCDGRSWYWEPLSFKASLNRLNIHCGHCWIFIRMIYWTVMLREEITKVT
jgi:hypothetical protein